MIYTTVRQTPMYRQMSVEEFLFQSYTMPVLITNNTANTRTYKFDKALSRLAKAINVNMLVWKLAQFNALTAKLREVDRHKLYDTFRIPKRSGGMRKISAPKEELKSALRDLKDIFENDFHALYHTSAFAYIRQRDTYAAVKRHQQNESKWFGKFDLHDFFGSTTLDFVMRQFSQIFPFSEVIKTEAGASELRNALELAFLDGGLPQGTPISPIITNIMMIPVDFELSNRLREFEKQSFVYTRYADDFIISSKYDFDITKISKLISDVLAEFSAPFTLNAKKTRYGSSSGRNWNLGIMLTKDNQMTVGHKRKRQFQAMLYNYITDRKKGVLWSREDIQVMEGVRSYIHRIEPDATDAIVEHYDRKFGVNLKQMIRQDLNK